MWLADTRENGDAIPSPLALPHGLIAGAVDRLGREFRLRGLKFLQADNVRLRLTKPGEQVRQPLADVVDVEGCDLQRCGTAFIAACLCHLREYSIRSRLVPSGLSHIDTFLWRTALCTGNLSSSLRASIRIPAYPCPKPPLSLQLGSAKAADASAGIISERRTCCLMRFIRSGLIGAAGLKSKFEHLRANRRSRSSELPSDRGEGYVHAQQALETRNVLRAPTLPDGPPHAVTPPKSPPGRQITDLRIALLPTTTGSIVRAD